MLVSIPIPCYEMGDFGVKFLDLSLNKICAQTYKNLEVIISDHSCNEDIKNLCLNFSDKIKIVYVKNTEKRGSSSANLNNAIKKCSGEIIKILMQDEYLLQDNALEKIVDFFKENENVGWLINNCVFGEYPDKEKGRMIPFYSKEILNSINTIGSPSNITIKNEHVELFDEDLIWVMDCEYYVRMYNKFGNPHLLNEYITYIIQHEKQVTNLLNKEIKNKEEKELKQKYLI